jgi:16S rRNA (cytidine1402-2'-O)-methyltransferase
MANLYIVATPIGNLEDISARALCILEEVDLLLCEDTRVTQKLLNHFEIKTPTLSYHQHSKITKINDIISQLKRGRNIALVSDAGTPGISDPGNKLIESVLNNLGDEIKIIPIPGPSAVSTMASVSGFPMDKFCFMGFPPIKNKRKKFFEEVINSKYPVILYESRHRIIKTLTELEKMDSKLKLVVGRELTKLFETTYRGSIKEVLDKVKNDKTKGEFTIVINK